VSITDAQWEFIRPFIPQKELEEGRPGRPFVPAREVLDGVLWVLRTGAQWNEMPKKYPPYQTCHRRYQKWIRAGVMVRLLRALAEDLRDRGKLDLTEAYIDGSHAGAKKGGLALERLAAARQPRSWQFQTALAFLSPLGLQVVNDMRRSS
jgi:transposase